MKKIAIDVDEVLYETLQAFIRFLREKKGIVKEYEDVRVYSLNKSFGITKEEEDTLHKIFHSEFNSNPSILSLVEGAREGVRILAENYDIYFVSARSSDIFEKTKEAIERDFVKNPQIYFSGDLFKCQKKNKEEICKELGINLIIEDNGLHSLKYAKKGMRVLLLDKPWNRGFSHENIIRFSDWREIVKYLERENEES